VLQDSANLTFDGAILGVNGVSVGRGAGAVATNTALGASALNSNTTGATNTSIGYQALQANTTSSNNIAIGYRALFAKTTTDGYVVAIGNNAGIAITTTGYSTIVGHNSFTGISTAYGNTGFGYGSGTQTTTGEFNSFIGGPDGATYGIGSFNTTGSENVIVGSKGSFKNNTTGGYNTGLGSAVLVLCTGNYHTAIGQNTLAAVTSGSGNTALGLGSGNTISTGNWGIYVGANANASGANVVNEINIGTAAGGSTTTGKGSSTGFINPAGGGVYQGNNASTWSTTSDQRLKKNIVDNTDGLNVINCIRIRNFEYRLPEEVDAELKPTDAIKKAGIQLGVIAQELQAVLPDCVKQESTGVLSVNPDNLTWYLVNAVQELSAEVASLKSQLKGV
jgi:hypothetical protein